ncbi:uncharacterized protein LOC112090456 isoform X2 [Morus notabilis]|uniref:uncharacterized protein LOC112090456 isoform X2 n=1 Tax=Morus notabilis TaxID=981085 RepID=UPI000CECF246|nr:uncharacterized protein LOC112090456 isoform X2 [Morus notabilis]
MSFLMGLNDSFAQIRGQLLLLDPLPPINKVFALLSQEERQRSVVSHNSLGMVSTSSLAFVVKQDGSKRANSTSSDFQNFGNNRGQRKERPFCTHCNFHGHTIEKCYKIHGYPPGYKPRPKFQNAVVNHTSSQLDSQIGSHSQNSLNPEDGAIGGFLKTLNNNQYQQLMTALSSHLATSMKDSVKDVTPTNASSSSFLTGLQQSEDDWQG